MQYHKTPIFTKFYSNIKHMVTAVAWNTQSLENVHRQHRIINLTLCVVNNWVLLPNEAFSVVAWRHLTCLSNDMLLWRSTSSTRTGEKRRKRTTTSMSPTFFFPFSPSQVFHAHLFASTPDMPVENTESTSNWTIPE